MFSRNTANPSNGAADQALDTATRAADQAIAGTRRATEEALDTLSTSTHLARDRLAPLLERAQRASDGTVGYIRDEPVKAMLIAAATGAALMAILGLVTRSRR